MSSRSQFYQSQPRDAGWRRSALVMTMLLGSLATAIAMIFLTATQLTERGTAQQFLSPAVRSLLEIDQFVLNVWPLLEAAAAQDDPVTLSDFPISLQLDPASLRAGPDSVSDSIAAATASLIYDDGLAVLSDAPRTFSLVSQGAAFDGTVGRLTGGGHTVATVALILSGTLAVLMAMATATQSRGLMRIAAPALMIGLGATLIWIAAIVAQSSFTGQAESTPDLFAADLWLLAADATSLLVRNAAIVALAAGIVIATTVAGGILLRTVERPGGIGVHRFR